MSTRQHVNPSTCLPVNMSILLLSVDLSIHVPISLSTCRSAYYLDLSIYQPVYPSTRLSINLSTSRFAYLSICLFFYFSACLPVDLSIRPSINLSTRRFVYLSTYQPVYFSICLRSVYPSTTRPVYLSNHLFVNLFIRQFLHL